MSSPISQHSSKRLRTAFTRRRFVAGGAGLLLLSAFAPIAHGQMASTSVCAR